MKQTGIKSVCLIGLGQITQRYVQGLRASPILKLCAVSDINEEAVSRPLYNDFPFYSDYKQMLAEKKPDYAIISTPPESHFEIAAHCLQNGVNVIIEKPVVLCMEHFDALVALAKEKDLIFRTLFHWHGGIETIAFTKNYDLSQIREIHVQVRDPYCADAESINADRRPLMGAWIDSGVNALSMIRMWLPFEKVEVISTQVQRCKQTDLPVYVTAELRIDGVKTQITSDWRQGVDRKESFVLLEDRWVHINHSGQCISDGAVTQYGRMPRMEEHYMHLFGSLEEISNTEFSRAVHEVLFQVRELL